MSEIIQGVNVAANNMRGALVKLLVDLLKETGVWQKATQAEQEKILQRADEMAAVTVSDCVRIIAADSRPHILAKVKGVNFKAGVEASIFVDKTNPHRHDLADHVGQEILVVMPYGERYQGSNSGVRSEPNNKAMFDGDGNPDPDAAAAAKPKGRGGSKSGSKSKNKAKGEPAGPAAEFKRDDAQTQKLLLLADCNVPAATIATWSDEQVKAAELWAADMHYAAADADATPPEAPEFLASFRSTLGAADTSDAGQLDQAMAGLQQEPEVHTDNGRDPLLTQEACERMGIVVPIDAIEKWPLETLMRVEEWCEKAEAAPEGKAPPMPAELLKHFHDTQAAAAKGN